MAGEQAETWHRIDTAPNLGSYFLKTKGIMAALAILTSENGYNLDPKQVAMHPRLVSPTDQEKYVGEYGFTTTGGPNPERVALRSFVIPTPPEL